VSPIVFVSAPSILDPRQEAVHRQWCDALAGRGFAVTRLARDGYASDPWEPLSRLIGEADGVLVLGFQQVDIRHGVWRPGTVEEARVLTPWTSPWMQIEAGIAIGAGLPVLAVADVDVREGVFEPANWSGKVFGTPWCGLESTAVDSWSGAVVAFSRRSERLAD
jgi:hypothetical protein